MIATFKIKNFRSIKEEQTLSFIPSSDTSMQEVYTEEVAPKVRLLKLGAIYGSNASGKTNILLALDFFSKFMIEKDLKKGDQVGVIPFLLDQDSNKEPTSFELVFYLDAKKYKLSLVVDHDVIYSESLYVYNSFQPSLLYSREYNTQKNSTNITFGLGARLKKRDKEIIIGNTISNRTVIAAFGISNVGESPIDKVYNMFSQQIAPIMMPTASLITFTKNYLKNSNSGLKSFVLHFLRASDFNISNIEIDESYYKEKLMFTHHTSGGNTTLNEVLESGGTKRYLGLATILYDLLVRGSILPIDEIETSIHYELLSYFIRVFLVNSKRQAQLIFTTHDINLLDEDYIRRDTIWFTDKNAGGETNLLRLSSIGLHKHQSVYNAYRQEKIVNLPFTDSIYLNMEQYEKQTCCTQKEHSCYR